MKILKEKIRYIANERFPVLGDKVDLYKYGLTYPGTIVAWCLYNPFVRDDNQLGWFFTIGNDYSMNLKWTAILPGDVYEV